MKNEDALKAFHKIKNDAQAVLNQGLAKGCEGYYKSRIELAETAIKALELNQKSNENQTRSNEPLTLEQLRGMDGQPVWVAIKSGFWGIVSSKKGGVIHSNGAYIPFGSLAGRAYAYPPAHIDREAWEPCAICSDQDIIFSHISGIGFWGTARYCPNCGRPLYTEEAWAELEKRLRG